ncbi:hypothetical protein WQ3_02625 [Enterococcus faecalis EnGen0338]|uniref:hypothetical protein n=2 Tax=Enterococcus faecalis TaxID=1351 RepID=UPI00032DD0A3|nr:hypothetical protein [Enterococcus faecalis]EOK19362.1 hypothetical protein WQ3_02625 [Enterococcus faecalis EnGen0338]RRQ93508.1 hypothetical protein CUR49_03540 [Enterococcus faecalis]
MTQEKDLLLLKEYVIKTYQQDLEFIIATAVEAELRGLLSNSFGKADFYKGQQACLEQVLEAYKSISENTTQDLLGFLSEKERLWETDQRYTFNQSQPYKQGYEQRMDICRSLLTGLQGFLKDTTFIGTTKEYITVLEEADQFADKQLMSLLFDMGLSMKELQHYQIPFWKEYISVYHFNMRELYFVCPDLEANPMPILKKEIERLKSNDDRLSLSMLVEEKFQNVINELCTLVKQFNEEQ